MIDLRQFIDQSTIVPARAFSIEGRGTLSEGAFADIVVFDPENYAPRADFLEPTLFSTGVQTVVINGVVALEEGAPTGKAAANPELLKATLSRVEVAYQNLESVELGVTTVDHYFDTLGGISRAVKRARGQEAAVYISDQTRGSGKVRTLADQVALETRSRSLNPKWFEGMLKHGAQGVRQIEAQVTNTLGWSATTGSVEPWVYQRLSETCVPVWPT